MLFAFLHAINNHKDITEMVLYVHMHWPLEGWRIKGELA